MISGKGKYIKESGEREEVSLTRGEIVKVEGGVPHIMVPEEDCITFEWWDGDFQAQDLIGVFEDYTDSRIGPDKLKKL